MAQTSIKEKDARLLISYLLNNDSVNVDKLVNTYVESVYSSYANEQTKVLMESISSITQKD